MYKDFSFDRGEYNKATEYSDTNALILAARNILLARPGNYPFNPSIGMDIQKYQFDFLDSTTIDSIKDEFSRQLALYCPNLDTVQVSITKVEDKLGYPYLGISISSISGDNKETANFLLKQHEGVIDIINETI